MKGQGGNMSLRRIEREAKLDRQRLRTNNITPRQRWVPQLVKNKNLPDLINEGTALKITDTHSDPARLALSAFSQNPPRGRSLKNTSISLL